MRDKRRALWYNVTARNCSHTSSVEPIQDGEKERNESKRIFIWIPENDQVNRDVPVAASSCLNLLLFCYRTFSVEEYYFFRTFLIWRRIFFFFHTKRVIIYIGENNSYFYDGNSAVYLEKWIRQTDTFDNDTCDGHGSHCGSLRHGNGGRGNPMERLESAVCTP